MVGRVFGVLLLVGCLSLLGACQPSATPGQASRIVYGLTLAPSGIDPHIDASAELGIPLSSVYDTLVRCTATGGFEPGLATSWEVSADGRTYTFHLRKGVYFHDGARFDAWAVKKTLDRIVAPETGSRKAIALLGPYEGAEVLDEYTIRIRLREPFAPLLDGLSQVYLAPASPAALDKWGSEYQFHQVGTGPFMMKEYVPKDHLTLVRNPNYPAELAQGREQPYPGVDIIEFRFYTEPASRLPALEAGDADIVGEIPPQDVERLKENQALDLVRADIPGVPLVAFLNSTNPPTDDLRVRQALIWGADREEIVRAVFGGYSPVAQGPLSHNHQHYSRAVEQFYPRYDPARAAQLLEQAGWQLEKEGELRQREGVPLRVEALVMSWGLVPQVSELLQAQYRRLGIELVLNQVTFSAALAAMQENRYNMVFWSEAGADGDVLRLFFHSENMGLRNWSRYSSTELDSLLDEARRAADPGARAALYARVQELVMREALVLPIRDYVNLTGVRRCVRGLRFDCHGWFPLLAELRLAQPCR